MHFPIIVIGAGSGGLVVAIGAAKAGKKVLLIEQGNYGGDCTNYGCIPSKALIAAAEVAHAIKSASKYGITAEITGFNAKESLERTRQIVRSVRKTEEPEALAEHGVKTLTGTASFVDSHTLRVLLPDGSKQELSADHIVLATGSSPIIPPIPGLDSIPFLTNETIFDLTDIPEHLGVLGGGPIGSELGQAFRRLGSQVSIIQRAPHLMVRESLQAQEKMEAVFKDEGINLYLGCTLNKVNLNSEGKTILITDCEEIPVSHLLVSAGRRPSLKHLNLEAAQVATDNHRLIVDAYGRTSQKHIWTIGDAAGRAIFTHVAENEGRTVLTNLLLPGPLKIKIDAKQPIPRVTYTDPEVASIGLTEAQAIDQYGKRKIAVYTLPYTELDRAIASSRTEGFATVVTKKWSSKILGATIVGPRAGEMLAEISVAMKGGIPLKKLSKLIHPYPTYSLAIRKLADMWLTKTVFPSLKKFTRKGS